MTINYKRPKMLYDNSNQQLGPFEMGMLQPVDLWSCVPFTPAIFGPSYLFNHNVVFANSHGICSDYK